eukprot:TRINITY_DN72893_c0_g1_i1.p1 TRINITY_DN72893_c0_g1~~TRINITY_DN72893_c0_g1_i1.p1  ORF type:complete len:486 (-),score=125.65 TRINITY_DN72893_c0_g1_i1:75-1421(-)
MLKGVDLESLLEAGDDGLDDPPEEDETSPAQEVLGKGEASLRESKASPDCDVESTRPAPTEEKELVLCNGLVTNKTLKRSPEGSSRLGDGLMIAYRTAEGEPLTEAELGGRSLPWALEVTAKRINVGDVVEVVARGEYILADDDALPSGSLEEQERRWRFEIATVSGSGVKDKFKMKVEERIERANCLRELGNEMLKKGRLLRAADYYERGSSLMDVIEAEDMGYPGSKKDEKAVATNKRIRECQKPILLNWALVLMRRSKWLDAERKCTEVLLDIDKTCVKALFRRGQCHVQLGMLEEAKKDLEQARDLDETLAAEVERELTKLKRAQKVQDREDRGWAQKALSKGLGDSRSKETEKPAKAQEPEKLQAEDENEGIDCQVKENSKVRLNSSKSAPAADRSLMATLEAQKTAADKDGVDDVTYCRQREAIYNQFLRGAQIGPPPGEDD